MRQRISPMAAKKYAERVAAEAVTRKTIVFSTDYEAEDRQRALDALRVIIGDMEGGGHV